jgi:DNA-directed RNA polymerase
LNLYERQMQLEYEYSTESAIASQKQVLDALKQGRASDVGQGRVLVARAFEASIQAFKDEQTRIANSGRGGSVGKKYWKLLAVADSEVIVMGALRQIINACAAPDVASTMQSVMTDIGKMVETESMLKLMYEFNPVYTQRTVEYMDSKGITSLNHRYRILLKGTGNSGFGWESWTSHERLGVAKILLQVLYEATGLFEWGTSSLQGAKFVIKPTELLKKFFEDAVDAAKAIRHLPPMLIKPLDWCGQYEGGYITEWARGYSSMCSLRSTTKEQRKWVVDGLASDKAAPLREAMNKIQSTPYRVNTVVLDILKQALALRVGILGLPSTVARPKPEFPFGEQWLKDTATDAEMDTFKLWKQTVAAWHTDEIKRVGRKVGIISRVRELVKYQDESELYFPTFIDWRGRVYFRSTIHPQLNDAIKGCLEFAEGKRLGERGLFWLKVHIANSCGYDKHDPEIKAKWVDDNWIMIKHFINNPYDVDAPEPDTAFTLLQAALAYEEALELPNPEDYICHVPVAMDATCSGLQHLSALTLDEVGGLYTNLIDNGTDQKSDIYMKVAEVADNTKANYTDDEVIKRYWKSKPITRAMAKNPVMTKVYSSTLLSTLDNLCLTMQSAGYEMIKDGAEILYSLNKLAVPVAKALRQGVDDTVPRCAEMMNYMQKCVRQQKETPFKWVTPVGTPVINWSENEVTRRIHIHSMGVEFVTFRCGDGTYNVRSANNGIVPNFVHSMDSAHLCLTINDFNGVVCTIHDSFATHPSDVDAMHQSLRSTFVKMYKDWDMQSFVDSNNVDTETLPLPCTGSLVLDAIEDSRFMFC